MRGKKAGGPEPRIEMVQTLIAHWRETREKLGPMPEELWRAAVSLSREYGPTRVGQALRLDCGKLKRQVEAAEGNSADEPAAFVELPSAPVFQTAAAAGTVVELRNADGTSLTVRLPAGEQLDVIGLAKAFSGRVP